jgi:hypothetical protein
MGSTLVVEGIEFGNRVHEHELGSLQKKANIHCEGEKVKDFFAGPFEPF